MPHTEGDLSKLQLVPTSQLGDEELVMKITGDIKKAAKMKDTAFARNKRYRLIYQALDQAEELIDDSEGQIDEDEALYSNTYLAIGAAAVDTAATQLYNTIFSTPDYMKIDADDWEDELFAGMVTAHLMKRQREMKFRLTVYKLLQQMLCFDYAISYPRWLLQPGYVKKRVNTIEMQDFGGVKMPYRKVEMKDEFIHNAIDRSQVDIIDFFNCVHDSWSGNGDFSDSMFFADWRQDPIPELMKMRKDEDKPWGKYKNLDKVLDVQARALASTMKPTVHDPVDRDNLESRVTVYRYWTNDEIVEMANQNIISRVKIDGIPLQVWKTYEKSNEFSGMGLLQRIERNQIDINAIINNKRDFQNLILNPVAGISDEVAGLEEGDVVLYPGRSLITRGDPKNSLYFYQPGTDLSRGATEELQIEMEAVERVTGFGGENAQGSFASGRKTAREVSAVMAGIMTKVTQISSKIEECALVPIWNRMFVLEQTHLSQSESFKYHGPDGMAWLQINPEDYRWNAMPNFSARGSSNTAQDEVYKSQFMKAMEMQMTQPQMGKWENIFAKMWRLLDPKDHLDMIRDPREKTHNVPPNMENMLLAQGHDVEVSPENDNAVHLRVHEAIENTPDYKMWPEAFKMRHRAHKQQHQQGQQQMQIPRLGAGQQDGSDLARGLRGASGQG